jgi:hypothetical protein
MTANGSAWIMDDVLFANGVNTNDAGDADAGTNNLQNYPVLTSAATDGVNTTVQGTLNSAANSTFRVEFFSTPTCDASGNGQGQVFLGFVSVTTVGNVGSFSAALPATAPGSSITSTATDANGNTSEFSACKPVTSGDPTTPIADAGPDHGPGFLTTNARIGIVRHRSVSGLRY